MRILRRFWFLFVLSMVSVTARAQKNPALVLQGVVHGNQNKTYIEVPFSVPERVHRVSIDFSYEGKDEKTVLDLGVFDPFRFRGNSGGNKSHITISETDATPSYLPGAIPAGMWKLLISVPNIRATENAPFRAEIRFNSTLEDSSFTLLPLSDEKRWYRGDLHMHTAHSDGSCPSQSRKSVPCPLFLTAQAAVAHGLDFIAVTDHNTESQYNDMRELQPYFDRLLLIPGREITTFHGHFNIFGVTEFVDYRWTLDGKSLNRLLRGLRDRGGIASINHADAPGGEICMGCAWEMPGDVDMSLFTGVEVINGGGIDLSSEDFWDQKIAMGNHLTGIGGSDNHNALIEAGTPGAVGWPTTVVEAKDLSVSSILDGIRNGRVFVDLTASRDKVVDLSATDEAHRDEPAVVMGATMKTHAQEKIRFSVRVAHCPLASIRIMLDGKTTSALPNLATMYGDETLSFAWTTDRRSHWLRVEVRDRNGSLMLVSNPIYLSSDDVSAQE
uniref:Putative secreted protein n=1 Tax=mine drainage metagenome TaxID=410659 RepID=E6QM71_9ZZZZ